MRCTGVVARLDRTIAAESRQNRVDNNFGRPIYSVGSLPRGRVPGSWIHAGRPRCPSGRRKWTMWKRDEAVKPPVAPSTPAVQSHGGPAPAPQPETRHQTGRDVVNIGKSVVIKGELNGSEDLTIEGQVEGKIEL